MHITRGVNNTCKQKVVEIECSFLVSTHFLLAVITYDTHEMGSWSIAVSFYGCVSRCHFIWYSNNAHVFLSY